MCLIVVKLAGACSVRTRHSSSRNIMSITQVQAVLDGPVPAHDGAEQGRDHDQRCEVKPCLTLGFSLVSRLLSTMTTAFSPGQSWRSWSQPTSFITVEVRVSIRP